MNLRVWVSGTRSIDHCMAPDSKLVRFHDVLNHLHPFTYSQNQIRVVSVDKSRIKWGSCWKVECEWFDCDNRTNGNTKEQGLYLRALEHVCYLCQSVTKACLIKFLVSFQQLKKNWLGIRFRSIYLNPISMQPWHDRFKLFLCFPLISDGYTTMDVLLNAKPSVHLHIHDRSNLFSLSTPIILSYSRCKLCLQSPSPPPGNVLLPKMLRSQRTIVNVAGIALPNLVSTVIHQNACAIAEGVFNYCYDYSTEIETKIKMVWKTMFTLSSTRPS